MTDQVSLYSGMYNYLFLFGMYTYAIPVCTEAYKREHVKAKGQCLVSLLRRQHVPWGSVWPFSVVFCCCFFEVRSFTVPSKFPKNEVDRQVVTKCRKTVVNRSCSTMSGLATHT